MQYFSFSDKSRPLCLPYKPKKKNTNYSILFSKPLINVMWWFKCCGWVGNDCFHCNKNEKWFWENKKIEKKKIVWNISILKRLKFEIENGWWSDNRILFQNWKKNIEPNASDQYLISCENVHGILYSLFNLEFFT